MLTSSWFKLNDRNSLRRMPFALSTRMSHVQYHADRHEQWKRVIWSVFFSSGPKTATGGENVSLPTTGLLKGQQW